MSQPDTLEPRPEITRFEVIDHRPRAWRTRTVVASEVDVTVAIQDDGTTMKVFLRDRSSKLASPESPE
jgi:hypothetical protein